ncbi:hypothetical protein J7337_005086 [Fusarium musae]|uniref:Uncharacterized protein n=1 Tax=Fusarium musae TaxID=1042133 RepID=A0A9P8DHX3_9HYPO|nr:hypothetical protein J7337_005086 [Fusarium musae]KAG9502260.1 hypothetical protein J7337_005086 [Fusarium musae]
MTDFPEPAEKVSITGNPTFSNGAFLITRREPVLEFIGFKQPFSSIAMVLREKAALLVTKIQTRKPFDKVFPLNGYFVCWKLRLA